MRRLESKVLIQADRPGLGKVHEVCRNITEPSGWSQNCFGIRSDSGMDSFRLRDESTCQDPFHQFAFSDSCAA
jgi:hypothetical protein